jgi:hypothetical protein
MELVKGPRCDHVRGAADKLLAELELNDRVIERILAMDPPLPQQQIHADLHSANVLIHEGKVSAVLDFEFSAPDWTGQHTASPLGGSHSLHCALACMRFPVLFFCIWADDEKRYVAVWPVRCMCSVHLAISHGTGCGSVD